MKSYLLTFLLSCIIICQLQAETTAVAFKKITLKDGTVYTGTIEVETNSMIMIKDKQGNRFQFPTNQISSVVSVSESPTDSKKRNQSDEGNFCGNIELTGGIDKASGMISSTPSLSADLIFGNKHMLNKSIFVGIGGGYHSLLKEKDNYSIHLLPVYLRLETITSTKKISPYFCFDTGYSISLSEGIDGGLFIRLGSGVAFKLNSKNTLFTGLVYSVNSLSGNLNINRSDLGNNYQTTGNTSLTSIAIKAGIRF